MTDRTPPIGRENHDAALGHEGVAANTDRELWRKGNGDGNGMSYYEPSIRVTQDGGIGISVGGTVFVKTVEEWHRLAAEDSRSVPFKGIRLRSFFVGRMR